MYCWDFCVRPRFRVSLHSYFFNRCGRINRFHECVYRMWICNILQKWIFFNVSVMFCIMLQWPDEYLVVLLRFWSRYFCVHSISSWSDKPKSISPAWLIFWEKFTNTISKNVAVLSVVLLGVVINCSKECEEQNSK